MGKMQVVVKGNVGVGGVEYGEVSVVDEADIQGVVRRGVRMGWGRRVRAWGGITSLGRGGPLRFIVATASCDRFHLYFYFFRRLVLV